YDRAQSRSLVPHLRQNRAKDWATRPSYFAEFAASYPPSLFPRRLLFGCWGTLPGSARWLSFQDRFVISEFCVIKANRYVVCRRHLFIKFSRLLVRGQLGNIVGRASRAISKQSVS